MHSIRRLVYGSHSSLIRSSLCVLPAFSSEHRGVNTASTPPPSPATTSDGLGSSSTHQQPKRHRSRRGSRAAADKRTAFPPTNTSPSSAAATAKTKPAAVGQAPCSAPEGAAERVSLLPPAQPTGVYADLFRHTFINPFNGRLTAERSQVTKLLNRVGFRRSEANPLHLEWSPELFLTNLRTVHHALERKCVRQQRDMNKAASSSSAAIAAAASEDTATDRSTTSSSTSGGGEWHLPPSSAVSPVSTLLTLTNEDVLQTLLLPLQRKQSPWCKELCELLRRPDVFSVLPEVLVRCYAQLAVAYMPPKLDASPDPAMTDTVLTVDQANMVQLALRGYHLYIGGSAGTGKTVLLKAIFRQLSQLGLRVAMTATTGVAAVQLGGCTFHRAFNAPVEVSWDAVGGAVSGSRGRGAGVHGTPTKRWDANALRAIDAVIIDEVSLLNAQMFDVFEMEARLARMNHAPFGGIQVIVSGDFLQLSIDAAQDSLPVYDSQAFQHLLQLKLVTPMRHREGDPLLQLLHQLRCGQFNAACFAQLDRPVPADATEVTYIFPRRKEALVLNDAKLSELHTEEMMCAPQRGPLQLNGRFTSSAFIELPEGTTTVPPRGQVLVVVQEAIRRVCPAAGQIAEHDCVVLPARTIRPGILLRLRHPDKPLSAGMRSSQLSRTALPASPPLTASIEELRCGDGVDDTEAVVLPSPASEEGPSTPLFSPGAAALSADDWESAVEQITASLNGRLATLFEEEPQSLIPLSVTMALADMGNTDIAEMLLPLRLKLGCRVMVNRNLSRTVSNGSVGVVEAFAPPDPALFPRRPDGSNFALLQRALDKKLFTRLPVVRLLSGEVVQIPAIPSLLGGGAATYFYGHEVYTVPLQLGYGFTVHKVQGLTLQGTVVLDCQHFFRCPHLIYVACSRVRRMDQLIVRNITPDMVIVKRSALEFSEKLREARDPLVLSVPATAARAAWAQRMAPRVFPLSG